MARRIAILGAVTIGLCGWLTLVALGARQLPDPIPDVQKLGPQVGERVPDFSLTDQNGRPHTLRSVMGPKGAMLVFFRSADW